MSSTSITIQSRENIYKRVLDNFLKEANNFILKRNFMLGKGMSKDKAIFNMQYLNLLCNFSCDTSAYFEERVKQIMSVDVESKVPCPTQVSNLNEQYCDWLEEGNSGDFVKFLLEQINISSTVSTTVDWAESNW